MCVIPSACYKWFPESESSIPGPLAFLRFSFISLGRTKSRSSKHSSVEETSESHLHSLVSAHADTTHVARIRIFILQLLQNLVRLIIDVTLVRGPFLQVIAVVPYRATVIPLLVYRLAAQ